MSIRVALHLSSGVIACLLPSYFVSLNQCINPVFSPSGSTFHEQFLRFYPLTSRLTELPMLASTVLNRCSYHRTRLKLQRLEVVYPSLLSTYLHEPGVNSIGSLNDLGLLKTCIWKQQFILSCKKICDSNSKRQICAQMQARQIFKVVSSRAVNNGEQQTCATLDQRNPKRKSSRRCESSHSPWCLLGRGEKQTRGNVMRKS